MMKDWWQATFPKGRQNVTIIDANGNPVKIAYGEKGTGKPLFLMHGIGSWSYSWHNNIEPLSKHFRVICIDAKGHGFSDKPSLPEKVGHQIIELARIIQALSDEPIFIAAESLGALITLATAQEYPELFARLIVMNVPIFPEDLPSAWMRFAAIFPLDFIRLADNLRIPKLLTPILQQVLRMAREEVVVDAAAITEEDVYWITYPYFEFINGSVKYIEELQQAAQEIEKLKQKLPNLISRIQDKLSAIAIPTLILWSDKDKWFPVKDGEKLHAAIPNSQFQVLINCGHDAPATCPCAVNEAIISFLNERKQNN